MAIAASVGSSLIDLRALESVTTDEGAQLRALVEEKSRPSASITIAGQRVTAKDLTRAKAAQSATNPFTGIGLGKPLTVTIESVYLGNYPDTLRWIPGDNIGDVLVASAHKAFETFAAAPRALHLLQSKARRTSFVRAKATRQGSQLVYYSPAVTSGSMLLTIELSVDREFSKELGAQFGKAVAAAGALPVFAPAAPYLVAAGAVIPLATAAANLLARPRTFFENTIEINFERPGVPLAQPDALLLHPDDDTTFASGEYKIGPAFKVVDKKGKVYAGPVPYVVVSLDGRERPEYKNWTAEAASSVILERFFNPDSRTSAALDIVSKGLALYSDMEFYERAKAQKVKVDKARGAEKEKLTAVYDSYVKNIENAALKENLTND